MFVADAPVPLAVSVLKRGDGFEVGFLSAGRVGVWFVFVVLGASPLSGCFEGDIVNVVCVWYSVRWNGCLLVTVNDGGIVADEQVKLTDLYAQ